MSSFSRETHVAHDPYTGAPLHDLETWTFAAVSPGLRPSDVPVDAEVAYGFVSSGLQHWVYTRRAPPSTTPCVWCAHRIIGMSAEQARVELLDLEEDAEIDDADAEEYFRALHGRAPSGEDRAAGLASLCYAAVAGVHS